MERCINELHRTVVSPYHQDSREVEMKLHIYFEEEPLVVDRDNYLMNLELLEELAASGTHPIGSITSNQVSIQLFNGGGIFEPGNNESPYFGLINTNIPIEIFIREVFNDTSWISMGLYYVADWKTNTETQVVDITANDELHSLLSAEVPVHPVYRDITVSDFLVKLLTSLGVPKERLSIDPKLAVQNMPFAYPLQGKISETLQQLSEAFLFYFYLDREGKYCAQCLATDTDCVDNWDEDFVYSISNDKSLLRNYSGVSTVYEEKSESEVIELARMDDVVLPQGKTVFEGIMPSKGPVFNLEYVKFEHTAPLDVQQYLYNAWQIGVGLENPKRDSVTVNLALYGTYLETVTSTMVTSKSDTMLQRIGEKNLEVTNPYLCSRTQAVRNSNTLLEYQLNEDSLLTVLHRGTPEVSLGDTVNLSVNGTPERRLVISQKLTYDGSLTGESEVVVTGIGGTRNALQT